MRPALPYFLTTTVLCVAMVAAHVANVRLVRGALKPFASIAFVVPAVRFLPHWDPSTWAFCTALVFSFLGDVLLIPKGARRLFVLGLAAFLMAQLGFCVAFLLRGVNWGVGAAALVALAAAGVGVWNWLGAHVPTHMRAAVGAYIATIAVMAALAIASAYWNHAPLVAVGGVLFFLSDLLVARERFVVQERINGALGLPLYYGAQICLVAGMLS